MKSEKTTMTKAEMAKIILAAKNSRRVTWAAIAKAAGVSEVSCYMACLGENSLNLPSAKKVAAFLQVSPDVADALAEFISKDKAPLVVVQPKPVDSSDLARIRKHLHSRSSRSSQTIPVKGTDAAPVPIQINFHRSQI